MGVPAYDDVKAFLAGSEIQILQVVKKEDMQIPKPHLSRMWDPAGPIAGVVIAANGHNRRDRLERGQYVSAADVSGMENDFDALQRGRHLRSDQPMSV